MCVLGGIKGVGLSCRPPLGPPPATRGDAELYESAQSRGNVCNGAVHIKRLSSGVALWRDAGVTGIVARTDCALWRVWPLVSKQPVTKETRSLQHHCGATQKRLCLTSFERASLRPPRTGRACQVARAQASWSRVS